MEILQYEYLKPKSQPDLNLLKSVYHKVKYLLVGFHDYTVK